MAQKKYKFHIENNSDYTLNIGGGTASNLRLLVALPKGAEPAVTLPTGVVTTISGTEESVPPNVPYRWTDRSRGYSPSRLENGNDLFGVDPAWTIYLYPPNENKLVEDVSGGSAATFPTYIGDTSLEPGEEFFDPDYGEGAWVFYVPMTKELYEELNAFNGDEELVTLDGEEFMVMSDGPGTVPREVIAKSINVLGVAVLDPLDQSIIGFSPAPPDSTYTEASLF